MNPTRDLLAALSSLAALVAMESFTGFSLEALKSKWARHPELLAMLPALMDFRGNIALAHSSRMTTAEHLGDSDRAVESTVAALLASLLIPPVIALVTRWSYGGDLGTLVAVALLTVVSVAAVVTPTTIGVVRLSLRLGADPDRVAPAVTTALSDVLTVVFLFTLSEVILL
ncbi:magnesium transporter [Methanopyrus sp.]